MVLQTRNALHGKFRKIYYLAQTGKDSDAYFKEYISLLSRSESACYALPPKLSNGSMEQPFINGSFIKPVALTKKAGHGLKGDFITIDEAFTLTNDLAKLVLTNFQPTMSTRFHYTGVQPQLFVSSTEGNSESEFLNNRLDRLRAGDASEHSAFFDWGIPDGSDPEDLKNIYEHHPAAGIHWNFEQLKQFREQFGDDIEGFARDYGNRRDTGRGERLFSTETWEASATPDEIEPQSLGNSPLAFGVAVDIEATATSIAAATRADDGTIIVQLLELLPGIGTAPVRLRELQERYNAPIVMDMRGSGAALYDRLHTATDQYADPLYNLLPTTSTDILASGQAFYSALESGTLKHVRNDELDLSAANSTRQWVGDAWRPSRHLPVGHSSPIEAAMLASWGVRHLPEYSGLQLY